MKTKIYKKKLKFLAKTYVYNLSFYPSGYSQTITNYTYYRRASQGENWQQDMRDEMIEEFEKYGGIVHIFVDSTSNDGNIYVKGSSVATAIAAVNALHGRFFAGLILLHLACF